ncbi:MAG TPA: hypothetical protein VEA37_05395, partial [Flavobacterium sp.]|nr:hypothetical protein [Flavobacterium sp.]
MTNKQHAIKKYIYDLTKGLVSLKEEHCRAIEYMILENGKVYTAKLHLKNFVRNEYEHIRTSKVTKEEVYRAIGKEGSKSIDGFYRWDIYSPDGTLFKQLFTVKSQL